MKGLSAPVLLCLALGAVLSQGCGAQSGSQRDNGAGGSADAGTGAGGQGGADAGTAGSAGAGGMAASGPVIQQFDTACLKVPDEDIAASSGLVGMVGQWHAYFYKKDGTADHVFTWSALQGSLVSDTHIVFDQPSKRWFITTIVQNVTNAKFGVQVMVSADASANPDASTWSTSIPAESATLIDNPQPTVSSDKVLLVYHGNCAWVVDKADLIAGNAPVVAPTTCNLQSADNWVAVKYGGTPPSTAYAVTLLDNTHLSWLSVDGTQKAGDVKLQVHNITIPFIPVAPVWGSGGVTVNGAQVEAGEVKAMWQNDHLYWAKTYTCPSGTCERLFDIDTATNSATSTDYSMSGTQLWFGVPGVDSHDNVWMLAAESDSQGPIGLALMGTYASGAAYAPRQIVQGQSELASSGQLHMGDYASAAQDPDGSLWLIGEYAAKSPNPLNVENSSSGCRAVHVTAP